MQSELRVHQVYRTARQFVTASLAILLFACSVVGEPTVTRDTLVDISEVPQARTYSALPEGWQHGAFLEIFVRGWRDSNGDGIGDLRGVTQSLDYLRDLGIKGIWLMPITRSADGDHGYAVMDYRGIEPAYGTFADFDELLREAHARGIGVIMDYVINHSSARHPLFVDAMSSRDSLYRDWYVWQDPAPTGWDVWGKNPWYPTASGSFYATFGAHMPDFNLENPATMNYHRDNLRFWLNRGLDGFRFDAVPHLIENGPRDWNDQPASYVLMAQVQALMAAYPHRYLVCEATANPTRWAKPYVCGSAFAFGLERQIVDAALGKQEGMQAVSDYFKTAPQSMATMVSNHDIFVGDRLWDQVKGNPAAYRLAAATYLLLPGTPFIYYGEEIGMSGASELSGDARLRTPMSWTARSNDGFTRGNVAPFRAPASNAPTQNVASAQLDSGSLLHFYKDMLKLRNTLPSIAQGSYDSPFVQGNVMGYQRRFQHKQRKEHVLVLINYGNVAATVDPTNLPARSAFRNIYPFETAGAMTKFSEALRMQIPAQSVRVIEVLPEDPR